MDVNSRPVRRLAHRTRADRPFDWPRLWCAATTAAGVVALGAVGTSAVPATQRPAAAPIVQAATGDSLPLHTAMPPAANPSPTGSSSAGASGSPGVAVGGGAIPALVLTAYQDAERSIAASEPGCHLAWQMLAGIGEVESGQANNGDLTANGTTRTPILGPLLDGTGGNAAIPAPGGGWVRAEGPMQFLPSTWTQWGVDGNGDGVADPNNIFDAALAAGHYLCADGRDLATTAGLDAAILSYNHSTGYLATVTAWIAYYEHTPATFGSSASSRPTPSSSSIRPTASHTPTGPSASPSQTGHPSQTPSASASPTASASGSPTPSSSPVCPSTSPTPTPTGTGSTTPTPTSTPTPTPSPTSSGSASPSPSPTATGCPSPTSAPTSPRPTPTSH